MMVHSGLKASIPTEQDDAMTSPQRVQLSRARGWRMPENTVSVARPGRWGNPFTISKAVESGYATPDTAQAFVVECFRDWNSPLTSTRWWMGPESDLRRRPFVEDLAQLRGKNLACWCRLDAPCHADVLLEMANAPAMGTEPSLGGVNQDRSALTGSAQG